MIRVPVHCTESVNEKLEAVYDRITERAYSRWLSRRGAGLSIVPFWAAAESELLCEPRTEVQEWGHGVTVKISCADVDPGNIRLFVTPYEMLALAPESTPDLDRWICRYVRFPRPIDSADASAEFENGMLRVTATLLNAPEEAKAHFRVA